jgi:sortase A
MDRSERKRFATLWPLRAAVAAVDEYELVPGTRQLAATIQRGMLRFVPAEKGQIHELTPGPDLPASDARDSDERDTAIIAMVPASAVPKPRDPAGDSGSDSASDSDSEAAAAPDRQSDQPVPHPARRWLALAAPRRVPLRPDRTDDGYRSVHSTLTRGGPKAVAKGVARAMTEVLITFGLIALLFAAYEVWGTTQVVDAHQRNLDQQLNQDWAGEPTVPEPADPTGPPDPGAPPPAVAPAPKPTTPPPGNALARMYIPRLDKYWVVVEGVDLADLKFGPGHYPDTAKPGEVGNFSVAGHRIPAIFWDLDQLRKGDAVVLETAKTWYVYKVTQVHVVAPTAVEVVAPVPGQLSAKPTKAMLTITTCNPKWDNTQRLVVHAELSRQQVRSAGRPAEVG